MEQNKNDKNKQDSNSNEGTGRINIDKEHSGVDTSADISQVDQQEGNMNHGTLGGNFEESIQQDNKDQ